jgi:DNA-binding transcriptional ArsR family regulator
MNEVLSPSNSGSKLEEFGKYASMTSDSLRALSHEHRLMILCLLTGRERSVGELEHILRLPQPAVSQQLARLRLDHLVTSRRDGRTIFYTTETARLQSIYKDLGVLLGYTADAAEVAARIDAEIEANMPVPVVAEVETPELSADGEMAPPAFETPDMGAEVLNAEAASPAA